jgi:hypothetical protein
MVQTEEEKQEFQQLFRALQQSDIYQHPHVLIQISYYQVNSYSIYILNICYNII